MSKVPRYKQAEKTLQTLKIFDVTPGPKKKSKRKEIMEKYNKMKNTPTK